MTDEKTHLLKQLDESRDYMWSVMDSLEPDSKVTPEWNKRDFFAHLAGWEATVYEIFRDYTAGVPDKIYAYTSVDVTNHESVIVRQSQTEEGAKQECEIYRFAIKTILQSIPAENYSTSLRFP